MDSCYIPSSSSTLQNNKFSSIFFYNFCLNNFLLVEKTQKVNAFSYRNVISDEESVLLIGSDKKTVVHKMIALHSKLISKIEAHQFEYLLFPCNLLPMKVICFFVLFHLKFDFQSF